MHSHLDGFEFTELAIQFSLFANVKILVAGGDTCTDDSPYETERVLVKQAVAQCKLDFFSGRHYAREALQQIEFSSIAILRGEKGNPLWPATVLGSITHDEHQAIAVVAHKVDIKGLGIDLIVKPDSVSATLQPLIATDTELKNLISACPTIPPLALAFSLKESVVKAVSPHIDHYLDLLNINLVLENNQLVAQLPHLNITLRCQYFKLKIGFVTLAVWD